MVEDIKASFEEVITNSRWMSDKTKMAALHKLDNIRYHVGYAHWMEDHETVTARDALVSWLDIYIIVLNCFVIKLCGVSEDSIRKIYSTNSHSSLTVSSCLLTKFYRIVIVLKQIFVSDNSFYATEMNLQRQARDMTLGYLQHNSANPSTVLWWVTINHVFAFFFLPLPKWEFPFFRYYASPLITNAGYFPQANALGTVKFGQEWSPLPLANDTHSLSFFPAVPMAIMGYPLFGLGLP